MIKVFLKVSCQAYGVKKQFSKYLHQKYILSGKHNWDIFWKRFKPKHL